jgi:hypothetical protein
VNDPYVCSRATERFASYHVSMKAQRFAEALSANDADVKQGLVTTDRDLIIRIQTAMYSHPNDHLWEKPLSTLDEGRTSGSLVG